MDEPWLPAASDTLNHLLGMGQNLSAKEPTNAPMLVKISIDVSENGL